MERAIQIYAVINFAIIGLSHALRPRAWVDLFVLVRGRGTAGVFAAALLNLIFGSIIVAFHRVWNGIPLVLTLVGWASVVKALIYFAFPGFALQKLERVSQERAYEFVATGVFCLLLAGVLGYHLWLTR